MSKSGAHSCQPVLLQGLRLSPGVLRGGRFQLRKDLCSGQGAHRKEPGPHRRLEVIHIFSGLIPRSFITHKNERLSLPPGPGYHSLAFIFMVIVRSLSFPPAHHSSGFHSTVFHSRYVIYYVFIFCEVCLVIHIVLSCGRSADLQLADVFRTSCEAASQRYEISVWILFSGIVSFRTCTDTTHGVELMVRFGRREWVTDNR